MVTIFGVVTVSGSCCISIFGVIGTNNISAVSSNNSKPGMKENFIILTLTLNLNLTLTLNSTLVFYVSLQFIHNLNISPYLDLNLENRTWIVNRIYDLLLFIIKYSLFKPYQHEAVLDPVVGYLY